MALSTITGQSYARRTGRFYHPDGEQETRADERRPGSIHHQHGRASDPPFAQRAQALVGLLQGEGSDLGMYRHLWGELEELLAVPAGKVRHRADAALAPEDLVRKRGYVAHMDTGAHHHAPLGHGPQRDRHQRAHGGEDYGRVELLGRGLARAPNPRGAQLAREILALLVAVPGEREDLSALMDRYLDDYVGGGTEAVEAEPSGVARGPQGAVADQARAQQRRGLEVRVALGEGEAEAVVGHGVGGVAAVHLVPGEPGVVAEVLPAREAVAAGTVRVAQPGDAHAIPFREPVDQPADPLH